MPGTRPGMTITINSSASAMLRPPAKCQQMSLGLRPRQIVEEPLAQDPVAAPFLQAYLVNPEHLAGFIGQLENPVNGDAVALDHRRHRLGIDVRHPRQHAALMRDQQVAADARRTRILLHAGILMVIALDGAGVIAGLHHCDKFIQAFSRRHSSSRVQSALPSREAVKCSVRESRAMLAAYAAVSRTTPASAPSVPAAPADTPQC